MSAPSLAIAFLGAPLVWVTHLLASYFVVAVACETGWSGGRAAVLGLTLACGLAAIAVGLRSYRHWRLLGPERSPGQLFEGRGVQGFLLLGGAVLAVLFGLAIVLQGISPLLAPLCE